MKAEPVPRSVLFAMLDQQLAKGGRNLCWVALIALLYGIGARISEVLPMKIGDVSDDGVLRGRIRRIKLKTRGKEEFISRSLNRGLARYIEPWIKFRMQEFRAREDDFVFSLRWDGKPINRVYAWSKFKSFSASSGISENFSTHSPRKTFAIVMYQAWLARLNDQLKAARQVQKLLGHKSIDTTIHYLELDGENPEEALVELAITEECTSVFRAGKVDNKIY